MEYFDICVTTGWGNKEDLAALMQMASNGIYIEDYKDIEACVKQISHVDLIDDRLLEANREQVKIHMYALQAEYDEKLDFIKARLKELNIPHKLEVTKTQDEDWAHSWKKYYKPFEIGQKLVIKPEWEEIDALPGKIILNIEPGLAFGTGQHETTKMCLELLESISPEGKTVLDVGCGSGILSVAALLFGAKSVSAIDIDPLAVKVAAKNAALNNLDLTVTQGDLIQSLSADQRFDIALANIIADAVIEICRVIPRHLNEGGYFICSGIIEERLGDVLDAIEKAGFSAKNIAKEKGWTAVLAQLRE